MSKRFTGFLSGSILLFMIELTKMTPKEIDQFPAGAELDVIIAEKVMGLEIGDRGDGILQVISRNVTVNQGTEEFTVFHRAKFYSTDISAAWLVVEKLKPHRLFLNDTGEGWRTYFVHDDPPGKPGIQGNGATPALAICRAALKTIIKERP